MTTTEIKSKPRSPRRTQRGGGTLPTRTRARGQIIAGVLLVVGAALIGALVFLNAGDRVSALAVRDAVPAGQEISQDNLISKQVAGVDGVIAVEDVDQVVGMTAVAGLVPGQIVTDSAISDQELPATSQALAGLSLTAAQLPAGELAPGDKVRILAVPGSDEAASGVLGEGSNVLTPTATVYSVRQPDGGEAAAVVTVLVPTAAADRIALYSAAQRVALVKTSKQASQ